MARPGVNAPGSFNEAAPRGYPEAETDPAQPILRIAAQTNQTAQASKHDNLFL